MWVILERGSKEEGLEREYEIERSIEERERERERRGERREILVLNTIVCGVCIYSLNKEKSGYRAGTRVFSASYLPFFTS